MAKRHLEINAHRKGLSKSVMLWAQYFRSLERHFCLRFPDIVDPVLHQGPAQMSMWPHNKDCSLFKQPHLQCLMYAFRKQNTCLASQCEESLIISYTMCNFLIIGKVIKLNIFITDLNYHLNKNIILNLFSVPAQLKNIAQLPQ